MYSKLTTKNDYYYHLNFASYNFLYNTIVYYYIYTHIINRIYIRNISIKLNDTGKLRSNKYQEFLLGEAVDILVILFSYLKMFSNCLLHSLLI